jgi:Domain of unknown function (DUF222)
MFVVMTFVCMTMLQLFARGVSDLLPNGRWLMHQDPSPEPGPDDHTEPDDAPPPDTEEGPEQGLFLSLPAMDFDPDQFAQSGPAPDLLPGALMATLMDLTGGRDAPGVKGLSDDQLIGFISAARRMESWSTWLSLTTVHEFTRRAKDRGSRGQFAADELADELHLTFNSADGQMTYSTAVAERLPACLAALGEGKLTPLQLRIIEDETRILSDEDARKADAELAGMAGSLTYGKLHAAAHRLVLKLDPEADKRRKEGARRCAEVRRFREESGNAGITARELPSADTLAAWQHVEERARALRAAGAEGTWTNCASARSSNCSRDGTAPRLTTAARAWRHRSISPCRGPRRTSSPATRLTWTGSAWSTTTTPRICSPPRPRARRPGGASLP